MAGKPIKVAFIGDTANLDRALAKTQSEVSKTSKIASGLKTGFFAVGAGLAAAGGSALAYGGKVAAANEQAQISFKTMLGSAEKAQSFLGQLQSFAAKTPFEFPELQTAASSLISAGIEASKVIPIMTTLGDVTSGMGTGSEGVKRATIALQQMSAAGRITGEDLNQLRDAGIPVYDLLASATGKSKEEVVKLAQAGKLGKTELEAMLKALETGKGLERFSGLMAAQSASVNGLASTLKDTLGQKLATAIQPAIPLIKDGFGGAISGIEKAAPVAQGAIAALVARITEARAALKADGTAAGIAALFGIQNVQPIQDFLDKASAGLASLKSQLTTDTGGGSVIDSLGDSLSKLAPLVADFVTALPAIGPTVSAFASVLEFAARNADTLGAAMPFLIAALVAYKGAQLVNNTVGRNSAIGFAAQTASTFALASANRSLAASMAASTAAQNANNAASNVGVLTRARAVVGIIAERVATVASTVARGAATAAQWLLNVAMSANPIGIVVIAIVALVAAVVLAWKNSETFRNIVLGAWNAIKAGASAVFGFLKSFISGAFQFIKDAFLKYTPLGIIINNFDKIKTFITNVMNGAKAVVSGAWNAIKSAFTGAVNNLNSTVASIRNKVVGALKGAVNWLKDAGRNIIQGLVDGIQGKIGDAINAVRSGLSKIRNLLPFSPAKEGPFSGKGWTLYSGRAIMRDLGRGITREAGAVARATSGALSGVQGALTFEAGGGAVAGGGGVVVNVTTGVGDPVAIGREVQRTLDAYLRAGGRRGA